jgi:hypothetical protein
MAVAVALVRDPASLARVAAALAIAAGIAATLAFGLPALLGHEPLRALETALAIHRAEYTRPRSYALWLLFNPIDFALFAGLPLALLASWRTARALSAQPDGRPLASVDRFRIAFGAVLLLLFASGLTRGEVGRLFVPLVPFVLIAGTNADERGGVLEMLGPAAIAAALTIAIASRWSF